MELKNKRIVVTGGGGFLGSHIVEELQRKGCNNIAVPRTKDGYDFRELENVLSYFSEKEPEIVFNCAAHQGGLGYQQLYPGKLYYDNLVMGANTMEAARRVGVEKYVNVVAACSYPGEYEGEVMKEEIYWNGPLDPTVVNYGVTKKVQTVQGLVYKRQYGFNSIHIILQNMYGPGEHFEPDRSHALAALIVKFHEAKVENKPFVEIWGTGKPLREWLFVEDAAEGFVLAAERYDEVEPINMGTGIGHSITELAIIIKEIVGYEGELKYDTSKADGAMKKVMDITKMKEILKWSPKTNIRDGIKKTYDWYINNVIKEELT